EMRRQLHLLHRRLRVTMVYVTHDQVEAMTLGDRVVVLRQGRAQQADTPRGLYDRPRNRFVAGFIGWPTMNFLDGRLADLQGRPCFAAGTCLLPLSPGQAEAWREFEPRPLTLGMRPEDVGPAGEGRPGVEMEIVLVEDLGSMRLATLARGDVQITVQWQADRPAVAGRAVEVAFDMTRAHLFDRSS